MAWGRLDDKANGNAKLTALSDPAWRMWGCGLIFCQDNLTDGFIPQHAIHTFGVRAKNKLAVASELCSVLVPGKGPLWHRVDNGFQIHDYLDWNDSKEKILKDRELADKRKRKFNGRVRNGVQNAFQNGEDVLPLDASENASGTDVHVPLPRSTTAEERGSAPSHPIKEFLSVHETLFQQRTGSKPSHYGGKEAKIAQRVISRYGLQRAYDLLRQFMASEDEFSSRAGYGVNVFESQINRLLAAGSRPKTRTAAPWRCPHVDECGNPGACENATLLGRPRKAVAS